MPELSSRVLAEIERLMGERGLSGRALAEATGIPQRTLADKLAGRTALTLDELHAIGRTLAVSAGDLVTIGLAIMADADAGTLPPGQLSELDALDRADRGAPPIG